jgi:hypothetical protein
MQNKLKAWLPHIIAVALFALVPVIYFLPALGGKVLEQSDIIHYLGVSKEIFDFRARFHTEPLWTNSLFCGMPAYNVSTFYAANLVQYIYIILVKWLPFPAGIVFVYCLGYYILLKVLDIDSWVSIAFSLAFGFASFFFVVIAAGHNSQANAIAFMAPVFAGVILAFKGKHLAGTLLATLALALELFSNHLQITYYLLMMLGIYAGFQFIIAIKQKQLVRYFKAIIMLAIGAAIAIGTNITSLMLTAEYSKYSTRGKSELTLNKENKSTGLTKEYATQWCYGVDETMTLFIPDYKGGATDPLGETTAVPRDLDQNQGQIFSEFSQYWGSQPITEGPVYAGCIVCFLALMGLFLVKGPFKWFLFITTLLAIILAWGHNPAFIIGTSVFDFFFDHVPGFNNFRSVYWTLIIVDITLPLLAALAIDKIIKEKDFMNAAVPLRFIKNMNGKKIFFISLGVAGGIALLCWLTPGTFSNFQNQNEYDEWVQRLKQSAPNASDAQLNQYLGNIYPAVQEARKKILSGDSGRTLIFILLAGGLIWVYSRKMIDRRFFIGGLMFFIVVDMYNVDKRYLNDKNFVRKSTAQTPFEADAADIAIQRDTSLDYRVYNTTARPDQDSRTSYFHKSLGGYSGVKMKRYDELMTYQLDRGNMSVINMLNAKYFIVGGKNGERQAEQNPGAMGNAWFVDNVKIVANADSEITALDHFDPKKTAIVDTRFSSYLNNAKLTPDSTATVRLNKYEPNDLVYSSQSHGDGLVVFSEMYYKDGWDAFIDGKPADYIRANYVLRAMIVPGGAHTIEFKFEPKKYAWGEKVSLASSLLLILACLGLIFKEFRKQEPAK